MTEPDPDDIAYVGDEDDERGPGCLVAMAAVASAFACFGCLGSLVWLIGIARDDVGPNAAISATYLIFAMGLSVVAGGFGLGLGLVASSRARLSPIPWLRPVAIVAWAVGFAAVVGVVIEANLLLFNVLGRR